MFVIVTIWLCSSHCDNVVMASHAHDIATIWLCSSHCDNMVMASHVRHIAKIWLCSSHSETRCYVRQIERLNVMFVTLQDLRIYSSHSINMVMFVTLR
jgi:hypothetical protein